MAETVARHLVATGLVIDEDPTLALAHAMAARRLASRIAAVREAVGLAAYHAGEWQTAIAELRTYHRMTGLQIHLAVLADCERALGRPERAIDLFRGADRKKLDQAVAIELLIVAAGARGDLGQKDAAVAMLQVRELTADSTEPWAARLRYAYADALLAVGRREEAREWFSRAADVDSEGETDAAERMLELDGVLIEGDDEDDEDSGVDEDDEDDRDSVRGDDERVATARSDDAAGGGYRDRDAGGLADDELTDAEAGSLASAADASTEPDRPSGDDVPAGGGRTADARTGGRDGDVRVGGDEAAERR
ncbi:Replicase polyprotein 1ab [Micromonospora sp. NPDC050980]|uniref:Replicase polyprotein 1ab n=1 Tax=Micromonospora sp. NPDC050980 TaxID=3155161 RepID=UPI0033FF75EF